MKLKFRLVNEQDMRIINEEDDREIGRVFTPSGTSYDKIDAIQVCGFSRAFELWGCGAFADNGRDALQDIQLLFKDFKPEKQEQMDTIVLPDKTGKDKHYKRFSPKNMPIIDKEGCDRCFHWKDKAGNCKCSELKVFRKYEDIAKYENRRKTYETKVQVLDKLKEKERNGR